MHKKSKLGFSLIELSIVILVIGILVIGITKGSRIMSDARLKSARALTTSSPVSATSDLMYWFESTSEKSFNSTEAADQSAVSNWYDINPQSTSNKTLTLGVTSPSSPTYLQNAINGLPALFFNASSNASSGNYMTMPFDSSHNTPSFTVFLVIQAMEQTSNWGTVISSRNSGAVKGYNLYKNSGNTQWEYWSGTGATFNSATKSAFVFNKPLIFSLYMNGSTKTLFQNGIQKATTSATFSPNQDKALFIGCTDDIAFFYDGYISEIIYFSRALKTSERQAVEQYLSNKWNIQLI